MFTLGDWVSVPTVVIVLVGGSDYAKEYHNTKSGKVGLSGMAGSRESNACYFQDWIRWTVYPTFCVAVLAFKVRLN